MLLLPGHAEWTRFTVGGEGSDCESIDAGDPHIDRDQAAGHGPRRWLVQQLRSLRGYHRVVHRTCGLEHDGARDHAGSGRGSGFALTEVPFTPSDLSASELSRLARTCSFIIAQG